MTARERVARAWHAGSGHAADGAPFGGPLCNCLAVAGRIMPMLRKAWESGFNRAHTQHAREDHRLSRRTPAIITDNPYEEDQMGQKCSFCEETTDDLTTGGGVAACRDCMAEGDRHVDQ